MSEFPVEKNHELGQTKEELELELLRQHCQSLRHAEDERLSFTNFFILVVVGALTFLSQTGGSIVARHYWMIYICLAVFSLLGLLLSLRLNRGIRVRRSIASELVNKAGLDKYNIYGRTLGNTRIPSLRVIFLLLYGGAFLWFVTLTAWCLFR